MIEKIAFLDEAFCESAEDCSHLTAIFHSHQPTQPGVR